MASIRSPESVSCTATAAMPCTEPCEEDPHNPPRSAQNNAMVDEIWTQDEEHHGENFDPDALLPRVLRPEAGESDLQYLPWSGPFDDLLTHNFMPRWWSAITFTSIVISYLLWLNWASNGKTTIAMSSSFDYYISLSSIGGLIGNFGFFVVWLWRRSLVGSCLLSISISTGCFILIRSLTSTLALQDGQSFCGEEVVAGWTWRTGPPPPITPSCQDRVDLQQSKLFTEALYRAQFARMIEITLPAGNASILAFSMADFLKIKNDSVLCYQGFQGNQDLYGMGIRYGIYLQWIASILSNNFLPGTRLEIQSLHLLFSIGICVATLVFTFRKTCTFSIEIEVLYWLFWGGFVGVVAACPNQLRLGGTQRARMLGLNWTMATLFVTASLMTYHMIWYFSWGYDQSFSRMPCGTWHFLILAPILDPSEAFCFSRDGITLLTLPYAHLLGISIPVLTFLTIPEILGAIGSSRLCRFLMTRTDEPPESTTPTMSRKRLRDSWKRIYRWLCIVYHGIRHIIGLPAHNTGGIRLITPLDIAVRR
ncbi:hypothetical protein PFICI_00770 [Pestalotiopsis fici W106-1]|uniref:Uncharacterized protein n=1 Tax=Pestalotiopsis fici (strain W106-1 / CGMCC3.15140) TaxID=1229662 RepID=W3XN51_PESFW|nr:uncharacterized protein PFICI_00770 [Pestalotiopsis fici W106-1]ETS86942.1 hypothetical protein PFICI_00770 [Pestalotiopsis fici W106-1]